MIDNKDFESTDHIIHLMCDQLNEKGFDCLVLGTSNLHDNHICSGSQLGIKFLRQRADIVDAFLAYIKENYSSQFHMEKIQDELSDTLGDNVDMAAVSLYDENDLNNSTDIDIKTDVTIVNGESANTLLHDTTCQVCGKSFTSGRALSGHMKAHKTGKDSMMTKNDSEGALKYKCEKCGDGFEFEDLLKLHQNRVVPCINKDLMVNDLILERVCVDKNDNTNNMSLSDALTHCRGSGKQKCFLCDYSTKQNSNLRRHIIAKHTEVAPYKCEYCSKTFKLDDVLSKHKMRVHSDKDFKSVECSQCRAKFESEERLSIHRKFKCPKRKVEHTCLLCGYVAKASSSLESHMRTHSTDRPFSCEQCGKTFSTQTNLKSHLEVMHSKKTEYKCDICGLEFSSKHKCLRHVKSHNSPEFRCDICVKSFASAANLKAHALIHANVKPLTCDVCGKCFRWKKCLEQHLLLHTGETPYTCETCGSKFRCYSTLWQHMERHAEDKHMCDVCGRAFVQKGKMNYHRKSHFMPDRFSCKYCKRRFKSANCLKTHLAKLHPEKQNEIESETQYKLHKCSYENCTRVFSTNDNLKSHIQSMHVNAKPYKCTFCFKKFNNKGNKVRHEKTHRFKKDRKVTCSICDKILTPQEFNVHAIECRKQKHKSDSLRNPNFNNVDTENQKSVKGLELLEENQDGDSAFEETENVVVKVICDTCGKHFTHKEFNIHITECDKLKQKLNSSHVSSECHTIYKENHETIGHLHDFHRNKVTPKEPANEFVNQPIVNASNYKSDSLVMYLSPSSVAEGLNNCMNDSARNMPSLLTPLTGAVPVPSHSSLNYNFPNPFLAKSRGNISNLNVHTNTNSATSDRFPHAYIQNTSNHVEMTEGQLMHMNGLFENVVENRVQNERELIGGQSITVSDVNITLQPVLYTEQHRN